MENIVAIYNEFQFKPYIPHIVEGAYYLALFSCCLLFLTLLSKKKWIFGLSAFTTLFAFFVLKITEDQHNKNIEHNQVKLIEFENRLTKEQRELLNQRVYEHLKSSPPLKTSEDEELNLQERINNFTNKDEIYWKHDEIEHYLKHKKD